MKLCWTWPSMTQVWHPWVKWGERISHCVLRSAKLCFGMFTCDRWTLYTLGPAQRRLLVQCGVRITGNQTHTNLTISNISISNVKLGVCQCAIVVDQCGLYYLAPTHFHSCAVFILLVPLWGNVHTVFFSINNNKINDATNTDDIGSAKNHSYPSPTETNRSWGGSTSVLAAGSPSKFSRAWRFAFIYRQLLL